MPRWRAEPEALQLGKDVPHPVRSLPAASNFRHRLLVVALLRLKETSQVVKVARVDRGWGCRHQMSRSGFTCDCARRDVAGAAAPTIPFFSAALPLHTPLPPHP